MRVTISIPKKTNLYVDPVYGGGEGSVGTYDDPWSLEYAAENAPDGSNICIKDGYYNFIVGVTFKATNIKIFAETYGGVTFDGSFESARQVNSGLWNDVSETVGSQYNLPEGATLFKSSVPILEDPYLKGGQGSNKMHGMIYSPERDCWHQLPNHRTMTYNGNEYNGLHHLCSANEYQFRTQNLVPDVPLKEPKEGSTTGQEVFSMQYIYTGPGFYTDPEGYIYVRFDEPVPDAIGFNNINHALPKRENADGSWTITNNPNDVDIRFFPYKNEARTGLYAGFTFEGDVEVYGINFMFYSVALNFFKSAFLSDIRCSFGLRAMYILSTEQIIVNGGFEFNGGILPDGYLPYKAIKGESTSLYLNLKPAVFSNESGAPMNLFVNGKGVSPFESHPYINTSVVKNCFDVAATAFENCEVRGVLFDGIFDDLFQLQMPTTNLNFHHNKIHGAGISRYGYSESPSFKTNMHVHHNIYDSTKYEWRFSHFDERWDDIEYEYELSNWTGKREDAVIDGVLVPDRPTGVQSLAPLPSHGANHNFPYAFYNNTIYCGSMPIHGNNVGIKHSIQALFSSEKIIPSYFINNIIFSTYGPYLAGSVDIPGTYLNGNLFYRGSKPTRYIAFGGDYEAVDGELVYIKRLFISNYETMRSNEYDSTLTGKLKEAVLDWWSKSWDTDSWELNPFDYENGLSPEENGYVPTVDQAKNGFDLQSLPDFLERGGYDGLISYPYKGAIKPSFVGDDKTIVQINIS